MNQTSEEKLAAALEHLAIAIDRYSNVMEVFTEAMPSTTEAKILGVSERTIRRRRKFRKAVRLLSAS